VAFIAIDNSRQVGGGNFSVGALGNDMLLLY